MISRSKIFDKKNDIVSNAIKEINDCSDISSKIKLFFITIIENISYQSSFDNIEITFNYSSPMYSYETYNSYYEKNVYGKMLVYMLDDKICINCKEFIPSSIFYNLRESPSIIQTDAQELFVLNQDSRIGNILYPCIKKLRFFEQDLIAEMPKDFESNYHEIGFFLTMIVKNIEKNNFNKSQLETIYGTIDKYQKSFAKIKASK